MARRCKCGCRTEIKPAAKCTSYMEKLGFATEECQQKAAIAVLNKHRDKNERKAKADKAKADKIDRAKHKADIQRVRANPRKSALEAENNPPATKVPVEFEDTVICGQTIPALTTPPPAEVSGLSGLPPTVPQVASVLKSVVH